MKVALRVQITGPLTRFFEGFAAELAARGYTDLSLANQLRLMADLSRWLEAAEITVDRIDHAVHESIETTQIYLDADLSLKERALARTAPLRTGPGRYRPGDTLLAFLNGL